MTGEIYLLLGSNLLRRQANLEEALELLDKFDVLLVEHSSIYETEAWGYRDQGAFLNMAIRVHSNLPPEELLQTLELVERTIGKEKTMKWGPRKIDMDILYYDHLVYESDTLTIPHAQIPNRRFTLVPLAELAPDFIHPVLNMTQMDLLDTCKDHATVELFQSAEAFRPL
jgi:2-amino-4-hydroxy-6-hydroxymethyldihydropteridine diphosphokinase